jgi:predicted acylesterase/phospholipase RssA
LNAYSLRSNPWIPVKQMADDAITVSESLMQHVAEFMRSKGNLASRTVELLDLSSLICNFPLQETLRRVLDLKSIRDSGMILRIAATNWTTGQLQMFGNADFVGDTGYAAIEASAAIPGIFSPVVCGDATYVDGGLIMNTPMKPAIDCGASRIHIIYVDPDIAAIPVAKLQSTFAMFDRSLAITFAARTNQDIENARWINQGVALARSKRAPRTHSAHEKKVVTRTAGRIRARAESDGDRPHRQLTIHRYHPRKDLGDGVGLLDFSHNAIQRLIDRGYEETIRHDCQESGCVLPV